MNCSVCVLHSFFVRKLIIFVMDLPGIICIIHVHGLVFSVIVYKEMIIAYTQRKECVNCTMNFVL